MIVDDEPAARRILREFCAKEPEVTVIGEYADGASALAAIERRAPQLLFLDIQMDALSGLQVARALNGPAPPLIVFVTAYGHYALEAFEVNATDFLLKPFDERRFRGMLQRVQHRWAAESASDRQNALSALISQLERAARGASESRHRLLAEAAGRMQMVDVEQIEVIEADRNYVTLRIGKEALHARSTLQQAEESMSSQPLLRVSRSCVVNIKHVREVRKTPRGDYILALSGGTTVASSEGYREKVRQHLARLMLRAR
jgi:two-component system LytT family response regulator